MVEIGDILVFVCASRRAVRLSGPILKRCRLSFPYSFAATAAAAATATAAAATATAVARAAVPARARVRVSSYILYKPCSELRTGPLA